MNYKGYEGLTQEQIKEKIIVEYYTTGGVHGKFLKKSQSGYIELKEHASRSLSLFYDVKDTSDYVDDLYQVVFENLWKYTPQKFCESFFKESGEFDHVRFFATAGMILKFKCFAKCSVTNRPGHSFMTAIMYASSSNEGNFSFDREVEGYGSLIETIDLKQSLDEDFDIEENEVTVTQILSYLTESELHIWNERIKKKKDRTSGFTYKDYRLVTAKMVRIREYLMGLRDAIDIIKETKPVVIKEKKIPKANKPKKIKEPRRKAKRC